MYKWLLPCPIQGFPSQLRPDAQANWNPGDPPPAHPFPPPPAHPFPPPPAHPLPSPLCPALLPREPIVGTGCWEMVGNVPAIHYLLSIILFRSRAGHTRQLLRQFGHHFRANKLLKVPLPRSIVSKLHFDIERQTFIVYLSRSHKP